MKARRVYVGVKTGGNLLGFECKSTRTLVELEQFYSTYGVIMAGNPSTEKGMSAIGGIFEGLPMTKIMKNSQKNRVVVSTDRADLDALEDEYHKEKKELKEKAENCDKSDLEEKIDELIANIKEQDELEDKLASTQDKIKTLKNFRDKLITNDEFNGLSKTDKKKKIREMLSGITKIIGNDLN